jgi:hypothetical protein
VTRLSTIPFILLVPVAFPASDGVEKWREREELCNLVASVFMNGRHGPDII